MFSCIPRLLVAALCLATPDPSHASDIRGDFNADGVPDVLVVQDTGTQMTLAVKEGTERTGLADPTGVWASVSNNVKWSIFVGDFDGNRSDDVVLIASDGTLFLCASQKTKFAAPTQFGKLSDQVTWRHGVGDIDGDGKAELLHIAIDDGTLFVTNARSGTRQVGVIAELPKPAPPAPQPLPIAPSPPTPSPPVPATREKAAKDFLVWEDSFKKTKSIRNTSSRTIVFTLRTTTNAPPLGAREWVKEHTLLPGERMTYHNSNFDHESNRYEITSARFK